MKLRKPISAEIKKRAIRMVKDGKNPSAISLALKISVPSVLKIKSQMDGQRSPPVIKLSGKENEIIDLLFPIKDHSDAIIDCIKNSKPYDYHLMELYDFVKNLKEICPE